MMKTNNLVNRRGLILSAAAAGAVSLIRLPTVQAQDAPVEATGDIPPVVYSRKLGDAEVITLIDGAFPIDPSFFLGVEPALLQGSLEDAFLPPAGPWPLGVTVNVIRTGGRTILIDAGAGAAFGPAAGRLVSALGSAGISPGQIDTVLVTHMHADHIGGLMGSTGAVFSNASLFIRKIDFDHFTSDEVAAARPAEEQGFFALAKSVAAAYDGRIELLAAGETDASGLTATPLHGHSPGHTGYILSSGGQDLMFAADAIIFPDVQMAHPEASMTFDADPEAASATRRRLLERMASERLLTSGCHLPFPSFGYAAKDGNAFEWVPETWQHG